MCVYSVRSLIFTICIVIITFLTIFVLQFDNSFEKRQRDVWRLECEHGVISDSECPVDGGWTPWAIWSPCQGSCEDTGYMVRKRQCLNPSPSTDGAPCKGASKQFKPCFLTNCTIDDYRQIIQGDPARINAYQQLALAPSIMERCLLMECPFEAIEATMASDNTWQIDPEALWNSLQCVKHNTGCSLVGGWGVWGTWSPCGARCGRGHRWRIRQCDSPPASQADLICDGSALQSEECEGDQCFIDEKGLDDNTTWAWSEWGDWSQCSEKCGPGVSRRTRTCFEKAQHTLEYWGTQCRGQHDEAEVCKNDKCVMDGGWSSWSLWGPCSHTCGVGRRSRSRTCTRPIPSAEGETCIGPRVEVGPCNLIPCESFSHSVAILNEDSTLIYNYKDRQSTLFHFYLRFMSLSPRGTLVCRGEFDDPLILLSMQKWHVCLDARGISDSCIVPRVCTDTIEPVTWHSALITVTNQAVTLRLDNTPIPITATFKCDPKLPNEKIYVVIGNKFHGEVQEAVLNFIPLNINFADKIINKHLLYPTESSNIIFEKAGIEEGYLIFDNDQYLRVPCFDTNDKWCLRLTLKPQSETGSILFLKGQSTTNWLHMFLQNMKLKLKLVTDDYKSETKSYTDLLPDQWYEITLFEQKNGDTIEARINDYERLHVLTSDKGTKLTLESNLTSHNEMKHQSSRFVSGGQSKLLESKKKHYSGETPRHISLCQDEFFIGGVSVPHISPEEKTPFSGIIASIYINDIAQDLHKFDMEREVDRGVQVSSRTASISGSYHELLWGTSNNLNMSCLHRRCVRGTQSGYWMFLDTVIKGNVRNKPVRSVDNGKVLNLITSTDNDLRGFYTCRSCGQNIVTYGVIGKIQSVIAGIDLTTLIAVVTTVTLTVGTLMFLIIEVIHDLRNGYGFFRDAQFTPEEEADALCNYIDDNIDLIGSKSKADLAKSKARRRARRSASRASFAAQEPQGLIRVENNNETDSSVNSTVSEVKAFPALPYIGESLEPSHVVYVCEPCYYSSPRHGSILSPTARFTSSSSFELTTRGMCSRPRSVKHLRSTREDLFPKLSTKRRILRSKMLTIQSSSLINTSPAQKVLQQFQKLKKDDTLQA